MQKLVKNKKCVSEVVGVIILLGMAIALFSVVYIMAINFPFNDPAPSVRLTATIDGDTIVFIHQGGESLSPDTNIIVVINGIPREKKVAELLSPEDISWNIGEKLFFDPNTSLKDKEVRITVVDIITNSIIMQGTIRG